MVKIRVLTDLPVDVETRLRKNLGRWRYRPATLNGEPVAIEFNLTLLDQPPGRPL